MGQPPHTRYKMLVLIVIFYELKKCLTLNQDNRAGSIAERSNSLVRGRGDPGSNLREVIFSGMAN